MYTSGAGQGFLDRFAGGGTLPGNRVAAVVAHPDDETLGLGAQLPRLLGITIVHVTDGAPRDLADARRLGFDTANAYAEARRQELEAAMALAGIGSEALIRLGIPDQEAAFNLAPLAGRIADLLADRMIEVVFTHAYEGGHPDHEATAFAVHAAADLVERRSGSRPLVVEMPFYHASSHGWVRQRFLPIPGIAEYALPLDEAQRDLKARMIAAHGSQRDVLRDFPIDVERFRAAPAYDFTILPQVGAFLYEELGWGLTRAGWIALVAEARQELEEVVA